METSTVLISELIEFPGNPRKGDVDAIAESLRVNGQYKPIIIQESTGYVLAGNHTLKAARQLGWEVIEVVEIDVDDEGAKRIVLADNRTSDNSTYDYGALADLLKSIPDFTGTGWDENSLVNLISSVGVSVELTNEDMGSRGLGTPIVHYDIVFDSEEQQAVFYGLVRYLKVKYPDQYSLGERLTTWINSLEL
jgi:hypothetical protein